MESEDLPNAETSFYVYLGCSMNMENDLKEEPNRTRRAAWVAFRLLKATTNQLTVGSKAFRAAFRAVERRLLKYNRRTQHLRNTSSRRTSVDWSYAEKGRRQMDTENSGMDPSKRPRGRPPTSAEVFVARMDELKSQLVTSNVFAPRKRRHAVQ
ncbi:unnamed protein product [Strongylus vulgaris]|uniref:Uncharacterized protein n=1 Tax=Strongylus vulgaris TaxID=40348 RepID=A0A3P7IKB7_STRVU|nr:unnamed protein product [Strongylus vulgaris]